MSRDGLLLVCSLLLGAGLILALTSGEVDARHRLGEPTVDATAVTSPTDWAAVRSSVTSADSGAATWTASTDVECSGAVWVCFAPRFAAAASNVTIQPAFFDTSSHTLVRLGDAQTFTSSTLTDGALYLADEGTGYWETAGNTYCVPLATVVSGTVTVYGGTR